MILVNWVLGDIQILNSIAIGGYFLLLKHPIRYRSDSRQHR